LLRVELSEWLATCFKIGHLPIAPGTWGSLAAVIGWWLWLQYLDPLVFIVLIITIFIIGVFATNIIIDHTGEKDPSRVVIDEVVRTVVRIVDVARWYAIYRWGVYLVPFFGYFKTMADSTAGAVP